MTDSTSRLLELLIAATPYPPDGADADLMLAEFNAMHADRKTISSGLHGLVIDALDPDRVKELAAREQAWQSALAATLHAVGMQRVSTAKLRGYG